eukprot:COSAG06_NODE_22018_length_737_cov_1.053292_2_plen_58_part_01
MIPECMIINLKFTTPFRSHFLSIRAIIAALLPLPVPPLLLPSQPLLGKPISVFLTLSC